MKQCIRSWTVLRGQIAEFLVSWQASNNHKVNSRFCKISRVTFAILYANLKEI